MSKFKSHFVYTIDFIKGLSGGWEIIGLGVGATAALASFLSERPLWVVVLIGLGTIGLGIWRARSFLIRLRQMGVGGTHTRNQDLSSPARRRLLPYDIGVKLPGVRRRDLAHLIVGYLNSADCHFFVLIGDVGSGKSSLLRSGVGGLLQEQERAVCLVTEPLRALESTSIKDAAEDNPIHVVLSAIQQRCRTTARSSGRPFFLLLDQFEDLLSICKDPEDFATLRGFLERPLPNRTCTIAVAVRQDYHYLLHELKTDGFDPFSAKFRHKLDLLSVADAIDIVHEISARDQLPVDDQFARIVATDLATNGVVRPVELSLVLSFFDKSLSLEDYRRKGGARGLLAGYVSDSVESTRDPTIAKTILRSLCNFNTIPPSRREWMSQTEVVTQLDLRQEQTRSSILVQEIIASLVDSRIISPRSFAPDSEKYQLAHDYLVGPVDRNTIDVALERERADQLLTLYVQRALTGSKVLIPRGLFKFIRHHATSDRINEALAAQILQQSKRRILLKNSVAFSAFVILSGSALLLAGATFTWERSKVAEEPLVQALIARGGFPSYSYTPVGQRFLVQARPHNIFIPNIGGQSLTSVSLWDTKEIQRIAAFPTSDATLQDGLLLFDSGPVTAAMAVDLTKDANSPISIPDEIITTGGNLFAYGNVVVGNTRSAVALLSRPTPDETSDEWKRRFSYWSLRDNRIVFDTKITDKSVMRRSPLPKVPDAQGFVGYSSRQRYVSLPPLFLDDRKNRVVLHSFEHQGRIQMFEFSSTEPLTTALDISERKLASSSAWDAILVPDQDAVVISLLQDNFDFEITEYKFGSTTRSSQIRLSASSMFGGQLEQKITSLPYWSVFSQQIGRLLYVDIMGWNPDDSSIRPLGVVEDDQDTHVIRRQALIQLDGMRPVRFGKLKRLQVSERLPTDLPREKWILLHEGNDSIIGINTDTAREHRLSADFPKAYPLIAISRDGSRLAIADDTNQAHLFDAPVGRLIKNVQSAERVFGLRFSVDERAIAIRSQGGIAEIITSNGTRIGSLTELHRFDQFVVSEDCRTIHVWTDEGITYRYDRVLKLPLLGSLRFLSTCSLLID